MVAALQHMGDQVNLWFAVPVLPAAGGYQQERFHILTKLDKIENSILCEITDIS